MGPDAAGGQEDRDPPMLQPQRDTGCGSALAAWTSWSAYSLIGAQGRVRSRHCAQGDSEPPTTLGFAQGGPDGPPRALLYGAISRAVKTSVGLVLEVGVMLLLAGAQSPPVGKTWPPASRALQFVFTKSAWNPPPLGCNPS